MNPRIPLRATALASFLALAMPLLASAQPLFEFRVMNPGLKPTASSPGGSGGSGGTSPEAPIAVELSTPALAFGDLAVALKSEQSVLLTNTSASKTLVFSSPPEVSGSGAFSATTQCANTLAPLASCATTVQFWPAALGDVSGSLTFATNASGSPHGVTLTGRGTGVQFGTYSGATAISTLSAFSNITVGTTSSAQTFDVKNTGNVAGTPVVTVSPAQFAVSGCSSSLAPGASCTVSVTYTPTNTAPVSGTVTVAGATVGSSVTVTLSGTSVAPVVAASLRADGVSKTGACADGQTGCTVLSASDKNAAVTLDAAGRTASGGVSNYGFARATMALGSDKYYWEVQKVSGPNSSNAYYYCGVSKAGTVLSGTPYNMEPTAYATYSFNVPNGTVVSCSYNGTTRVLTATYGSTVTTKTLAAGTYLPMVAIHPDYVQKVNFGQENFTYVPPAGYLAGVFTP